MNIKNISKENKEVIVSLSSDELVKLCNIIYTSHDYDYTNDEKLGKLYSELIIARDISQYGHIDDFCLKSLVKIRLKNINESEDNSCN